MKKLTILLSIVMAVSALAKTQSELASEHAELVKSGMSHWNSAKQVYIANSSDIASLFDEWKTTPIAKFTAGEPEYNKLTKEQQKDEQALRHIFAQHLIANPNLITSVPKRVACLTLASKCSAFYEDGFYTSLKSSGFILDGVKLPIYACINLAKANGDIDYIKSLSVEDGMKAPSAYMESIFNTLLESSDIEGSIQKCNEIENYLLKRKQYQSPYLSDVRAILQTLTRRMVNVKISGK